MHKNNSKNPARNTLLSLALLAAFAGTAAASALDARDEVGYVRQGSNASGWVNVSPATGGVYVYGANPQKYPTRPTQVFMVGKPLRQDFVYLTAQEQEGLWHFREAAREKLKIDAIPPATVKPSHKSFVANLNLNWPRVVVEGNKVCVPGLSYSEASDWKDHLLCTNLDSLHVQ